MAAVAGAVAEEILAAMLVGRPLRSAYVNNGGDSALHLAAGERSDRRLAGAGNGQACSTASRSHAGDPVRGIATSGWRGRSFSLGIADAGDGAGAQRGEADAAATVIANAVDLPGHPAIRRNRRASSSPTTTSAAGTVDDREDVQLSEIENALDHGLAMARYPAPARGLIEAAALFLSDRLRLSAAGCPCFSGIAGARRTYCRVQIIKANAKRPAGRSSHA